MFKKIMNTITGKDKTSGQKYEELMAKRQKKINAVLKDKEKRQKMVRECGAVLDECKSSFKRTITVERARADEMRLNGFDTATEEAKIKEAAVGILIVDEASFKLQSISSESDLNMAMNRLGVALRQLRRLDNSAAAISPSSERIVDDWCPGIMAEIGDLTATKLEVPAAMRSRIDPLFVSDLMSGEDFETCMYMARNRAVTPVSTPKEQVNPQTSANEDLVNSLLKKAQEAARTSVAEPDDISHFRDDF